LSHKKNLTLRLIIHFYWRKMYFQFKEGQIKFNLKLSRIKWKVKKCTAQAIAGHKFDNRRYAL
jgi:hypothetical protein